MMLICAFLRHAKKSNNLDTVISTNGQVKLHAAGPLVIIENWLCGIIGWWQLKGQGIYAFVVLVDGVTPSDELKKAIMDHVGKEVFSKPQQSISCQHEL